MEWGALLLAGVSGGVSAKLLEILYQVISFRSDSARSTRRFVDEHLDPLLKAADELVGKLRSLAEEDFGPILDVDAQVEFLHNNDFSSLLYLLAKYWANVEILRAEGLSVSLAKDERGRRLQSFLDCQESRKVRLVDRISQRAIGELMLCHRDGKIATLPFIDFVRLFEGTPETRRWTAPLVAALVKAWDQAERQRLLVYGVVLHAMIDTLDPAHETTKLRPSYPNKLTRRSWRDLKHRVFGIYLQFAPDVAKYLGPPR